MKPRIAIAIQIVALSTTACGITTGSLLPTAPAAIDGAAVAGAGPIHSLSAVVGGWTGTETATYGESGALVVTFAQLPTSDGAITASLSWTSARTLLTFNGILTGILDQMVITATNGPANACSYRAVGALNQAGTQITGTYTGVGPTPCPSKAGTFVLNRESTPPPPVPPVPPVPPTPPIPPIPPVAPACPPSYTYTGPGTFQLANSGDAVELAYVQANVSALLSGPVKTELTTTSWTSDGSYPVVLVKSAQTYTLYANVRTGDVLQSPAFNQNGKQQAISHVSRFACVG